MAETAEDAARGAASRRRGMPSRWGMVWIAAGIGLAIAYGVGWVLSPHPDATLQRTDGETPWSITSLLDYSSVEVEPATLKPYEEFRGLQPWSASDSLGTPCLFIVEPSTDYLQGSACTPQEADLIVDVGAWPVYNDSFAEGLPDGTIIRFQLRGDAVDVTVHRPAETAGR